MLSVVGFTTKSDVSTSFALVCFLTYCLMSDSPQQCYMAVAGVPKVRDDHAILMVRFAKACVTKMSQLLPMLQDTLGNDTLDLAMRVGMHSGSVTAGVLRGERRRFQLFGDTVNTASRMESNGQPGRIHVSSSTAELLTSQGKQNWLIPRADLVDAKGKGQMQTYWINFDKVASGTTCKSTTSFNTPATDASGKTGASSLKRVHNFSDEVAI